jgi:DNA-binding MarR family transcriptional regulator
MMPRITNDESKRGWTAVDGEAGRGSGEFQAGALDEFDTLDKDEIEKLAALRYALRQFSRKTEIEARRAGLTPQQYLLLLAVKGFPGRETATITELAERLQIRHNAVIGLVNRAEERGLVGRETGAPGEDRRIVRVRVLPAGDSALQRLASALRDERRRVAAAAAALDEARDEGERH